MDDDLRFEALLLEALDAWEARRVLFVILKNTRNKKIVGNKNPQIIGINIRNILPH